MLLSFEPRAVNETKFIKDERHIKRVEKSRSGHLMYHDCSLLYITYPGVGFPLSSYPYAPLYGPRLPLSFPIPSHLFVTCHPH